MTAPRGTFEFEMAARLLLLLFLSAAACTAAAAAGAETARHPLLQVKVSAPWRSSPTLERAAFYAATEETSGRNVFWDFVKQPNKSETEDDQLLKLSLGAGEFVAKVEAQTRLASNLRETLGFATASCAEDAWAAVEVENNGVENNGGVFATCDGKDLKLGAPNVDGSCSALEQGRLELIATDYIHPDSSTDLSSARTIIVHGDLDSKAFHTLWQEALDLLKQQPGKVRLVLRFQQLKQSTSPSFGGFSVSLDIKNTEYVAVDRSLKKEERKDEQSDSSLESGIYFSTMLERFKDDPERITKLNTLKTNLKNNREKLKAWELGDISIQTVLDVLSASDPLVQLKLVTENLPIHARRLAKIEVADATRDLLKGRAQFPTGVWLNGFPVNLNEDFAATLKQIREDMWFARLAQSNGIDRKTFTKWVAADEDTGGGSSSSWGTRVDVRKFAKGAVHFLNDIEKDGAYTSMSRSLAPLRQANPQVAMQQLIPVRRNLYTCILLIDPVDPAQVEPLAVVRYFLRAGAPIRFGLVFASNALATRFAKETSKDISTEDALPCSDKESELRCMSSTCITRLYASARKEYGADAGLAVLTEMVPQLDAEKTTCEKMVQTFADILTEQTGSWSSGKFVKVAEKALAGAGGVGNEELEATVRKMARYVGALGFKVPSLTFNGQVYELGRNRLDRLLQQILFQEQALLNAHANSLVDEEDILSQILRLSRALPRNSPVINVPAAEMQFISGLTKAELDRVRLSYLTSAEQDTLLAPVSFWIPLRSRDSCKLGLNALQVLKEKPQVRLAFISDDKRVNELVKQKRVAELEKLLSSEDDCASISKAFTAPPLVPSTARIVCNGRIIPHSDDPDQEEDILAQDLLALVEGESARVSKLDVSHLKDPDQVIVLSSLLGLHARMAAKRSSAMAMNDMSASSPPPVSPNDDLAMSTKEEDQSWTKPRVIVAVDPLSLLTPKAAAFALWMRQELGASVSIVFFPRPDVAQLPPSSFHRWAPMGIASFDAGDIPLDQLLTLKVATPQSWIVYPGDMKSRDPDNLIMSEGPLEAVYEIAHVLIDGHALDADQGGEPAAGMQLELVEFDGFSPSDASKKKMTSRLTDSIVMYNLGYWQMKAKPGPWRLRPITGYSFAKESREDRIVRYEEFAGPSAIELKVHKITGSEAEEFEEDMGEDKLAKWTKEDEDGVMHVFSLASGALYERFLRIMMLSVRKRSSGKIKFWLLENYMSAGMKRFLPGFAQKNGFEYELVTFKWPDWLRGQSERQRQIWGMKILFLDVLFPLNVKRIIYVDSDQVLRSDLRELWRMDLHGAPFAMTPFCDSRKETLGFQFWRQGYWATHLRGKPYHISALFVVDLLIFRGQSVGDRLRAVYQQLSADPNSLSNLDQDLPNFAQHDIPIYSLPQEWLWCESWCSDESKAKAKTIDLCNNPLHKEPKLEMAKRVIRGELFKESWEDLDREVGWPGTSST